MNVLFLNGSPKGPNSITIKTAEYLIKRFNCNCNYEILNVSQIIKVHEKDFSKAKIALEKSDLIIFCYPVYTFIVPYQLMRFIELIRENNVNLEGKFAAQISTSKHFYDVTAAKYIEENIYSLNMKYVGEYLEDMDDLLTEKGREEADSFFKNVINKVNNNIFKTKKITFNKELIEYEEHLKENEKSDKKDVVIVTNSSNNDISLNNMIKDYAKISAYHVRVINIRSFPFLSGCIGCLNCANNGICIFKDNFKEFLTKEIQCADAIIYAFNIENHFTHSSLKCFDDRQFCNGHRTLTTGKVTGYIITGHYLEEANLQTIVEARSNISNMYFCGVATNEYNPEQDLINLEKNIDFALDNSLKEPNNFYGVGGSKIFRDLVYKMQGIMTLDNKFYKKHGIYDFPQKHKMFILKLKFVGLLMKNDKIRVEVNKKMNKIISEPYNKVIEETKVQ